MFELLSGDCIVVKDLKGGIVPDSIEWFTEGDVSHVAIYIGDGQIVEAVACGVKLNFVREYLQDRYRIYVRRLLEDFELGSYQKDIAESAKAKVGSRYDFGQILADGVYLIAGKLRLSKFQSWFARQVHGWRDGYTCSELYSRCVWEAVGINVFPEKDIRGHTPEDLMKSKLLTTVFISS